MIWFSVFIAVIVALANASLHASSGTEGAAFLEIPVGAGPAALGSAYTALATDAYAPVWNPAGLAQVDSTQIAAQHLSYLESIDDEFLSVVHPVGLGKAFGFSAQYLGSGDIAGTDPSGNSTGNYSDRYGAYSLAYGQQITGKLSLGVTGKWINAKLADVSADAFAADVGALYQCQDNFRLALTVTNLGSALKFSDQSDSLPRAVHLAAAYQPTHRWLVTAESENDLNGLWSGHGGIEWKPLDLIAIRAGYKTDTTKGLSAIAGFTTGIGLTLWGQEFSYAWLPYGDLGDTQYFSLLLRFGQSVRDKANLVQAADVQRREDAADRPLEPDYRQLMELLSDQEPHVAENAR